ncbi:MAG: hypothetical protein LBO04_08520 [Spirochaetaceae bacterium]|nr:hypothetical protein [Spirochaetaceae bacterium]
MYSALDAGETLKYDTQAYYEFGEIVTSILTFETTDDIKKEIIKKSLYGTAPMRVNRREVKKNNGQPFSSIVNYIKNGIGKDSLNIIITDLYEQYGINQHFRELFQNAFEQDLAGAIFMIKGAFKGSIHSISSANESLNRIDGYSSFFILVTGDRSHVKAFSTEFTKQLDQKNLTFNKTLFIPGESVNDGRIKVESKRENDTARFSRMSNVNLIPPKANFFRRWSKKDNKDVGVTVNNIECYIPGPPADAQFVYIIKAQTDRPSTPESPILSVAKDISAAYFAGGKTPAGKPSPFTNIASAGLFGKSEAYTQSARSGVVYSGISIRINTKQLEHGYYKIMFNIVPDWVIAENAGSVADLVAGNVKGGRVKVLNLRAIYESILDEFAKAGGRSETFYIVKN